MPPSPAPSPAAAPAPRLPLALFALTAGAFGIGTTKFVIMGLLLQVAADLQVSVPAAGLLISGYALGVFVGAPLLTVASRRWPRKRVLVALMLVFTAGNLACALAPDYATLMAARMVTSLAHGTFFGVGAVVATGLVAPQRKASAIATMFTGLTVATLLGVPAGVWLGLQFGWRATFWAVAAIGLLATVVIAALVPASDDATPAPPLRAELRAVGRAPVLLGLATTVLGYAGVFTVYTYIQPLLTRVTGLADGAVSPLLLVFGVGMIVGNVLGGRLADRHPRQALPLTLGVLALVLAMLAFALRSALAMTLGVGLLGVAAFATVAPLQLWVLGKAGDAGRHLASSLNIGAFNLGNALGAWLGGLVIGHGGSLAQLPWAAALVTAAGLAVALLALRLSPASEPAPAAACAAGGAA
ncbi:MFS family sugar exporter [Xanthomonas translucens pv. poae]|uniref:MFS family sugar exporter n=2 Tax=Xanthomonas translucens group TaxID=3390202 RepID=A0A0K2ZM83_9XANT|nr:MFS transporter [Xanthomonas translucens]UKE62880.1 MFS transporter [Xanthomonas translucens pv. poae]CTP86906.1 MFS family sugar exporter [Xanthomonas translucens pv. poae]